MRMMFNTLAIAAVAATAAMLSQPASAERVCRQECSGPVCTEKCVETTERDRITIEGRGDRREERREGGERREERRDREPGVELKVPGVGVEIGR
jgi:hypothetical protein